MLDSKIDSFIEQLQAALSMIPGLQMNLPTMQPNMPMNQAMMPVQGMMVQQRMPIFPGQPQ